MLGTGPLPPGDYTQVRLVVQSARLFFDNPSVVPRSRDRHFLRQVDVLDRVEERRALLHRALERLASGDEAHAARALVDDGGLAPLPSGRLRPTTRRPS